MDKGTVHRVLLSLTREVSSDAPQCGVDREDVRLSEVSRLHAACAHPCEVPGASNSPLTRVTRWAPGLRAGVGFAFNGCRGSVWEDENVLEMTMVATAQHECT